MKRTLCYLALFIFSNSSFSQTNLDSLYGVWKDETTVDSMRIKAFDDYIWEGFFVFQSRYGFNFG